MTEMGHNYTWLSPLGYTVTFEYACVLAYYSLYKIDLVSLDILVALSFWLICNSQFFSLMLLVDRDILVLQLGREDRLQKRCQFYQLESRANRDWGCTIFVVVPAAVQEIEKLKLSEMTCREGVIEVAKIIYGVHDEAKDKAFELELSWVCDESNRLHQKVTIASLDIEPLHDP